MFPVAAWAHSGGTSLISIDDKQSVKSEGAPDTAPETYYANKPVNFEVNTGGFPEGTQFRWSWGDETLGAAGASATHKFAARGRYTVTLEKGDGSSWVKVEDIGVTVAGPKSGAEVAVYGLGAAAAVAAVIAVWAVWRRRKRR